MPQRMLSASCSCAWSRRPWTRQHAGGTVVISDRGPPSSPILGAVSVLGSLAPTIRSDSPSTVDYYGPAVSQGDGRDSHQKGRGYSWKSFGRKGHQLKRSRCSGPKEKAERQRRWTEPEGQQTQHHAEEEA